MPYKSLKNILLLLAFSSSIIANAQVYKDGDASPQERAESIVSEMTLEEKVSLMLFDSPAIPRLGIEQYNWWNEALHGVGRAGTSTIYPQPIGMAATFDDHLIYDVFCTVSDEARAKHHKAKQEGPLQIYQGLTFWTPNVNIYRDPRWGRGHETYGEDPYLTSKMGVSVVRGLQGDFYEGGAFDSENGKSPAFKHYKTNGCAKHYAVHSGPEWNRHSFDAKDITQRDLWETYLPSFKALVQDGNVRQVMCAYNRFEGEPCCGSPRLLFDILRNTWGYDGIVLTDCWAIDDFFYEDRHHIVDTKEEAAAMAVRAGTDLECGPALRSLVEGVKKGLITEEEINHSVIRLMKARYELGEMDPDSCVEWSRIPYDVVGCQKHRDLALDVARKTMVLLKNDGVLPFDINKGLRIGLIGPNANDSVMQWGNYNGFPKQTSTLLSALEDRLPQGQLVYVPGIDHTSAVKLESRFQNTVAPSGKPGFDAVFWKKQNVMDNEEPFDVQWHYNTPLQLTSAGATVWAPEVPLGRFTALFTTTFKPEYSEDITFSIQSMGATHLYINDQLVFEGNNQKTFNAYTFPVEAGKEYEIALKFYANEGDNASLNFDFGATVPLDIDNVVKSLEDCDVILFAGGLSPLLEGEEMSIKIPGFYRGDRTVIELPQIQTDLLEALSQTGKPVVLINYTGSCVGLEREEKMANAILQAWYPGQEGGDAVADVLFGDYNPSGRLPLTFFRSTADLADFEDYNFDNGRSYRYFKGEPLYHFGHGLSYTDFEYGKADHHLEGQNHILTIPVTNQGQREGDEIVQVYLARESDPWGPSHALRAFKRVSLQPGQTQSVEITLTPEQLEWFDEDTDSMRIIPGGYTLYYGPSSDFKQLKSLKIELK